MRPDWVGTLAAICMEASCELYEWLILPSRELLVEMWLRSGEFDWHGLISIGSLVLPLLFVIAFGCKSAYEDKKKEKDEDAQDELLMSEQPWRKDEIQARQRARKSTAVPVPAHASVLAGKAD